MIPIPTSRITSEQDFRNSRKIIGAGLSAMAAMACNGPLLAADSNAPELLEPTPLKTINSYNNYYEFGFDKSDPSEAEKTLITSPWSVEITGAGADKKGVYDLADIYGEFAIESHVHRFRCVEAWSMVVPWNGIPLHKVIAAAQPNSRAKYVRFTTVNDATQMPNANWAGGPYTEGLTIAEAMNPLALLATGIYDQPLEQQTGAPIRLVLPWKYGFKYAKSIVRIELVEDMPKTTWWQQNSREYGFYANVSPHHNHPRWSQKTERVIGGFGRQRTQIYNGYAEEVAHLYGALEDRKYFY
jgi:sulfoxide reductase catalytic subunit YedY